MKPRKLRWYLAIGRPLNASMVFVGVIVGGLLAGKAVGELLLPALSATLISMGAQTVNDYFDVEIDAKTKRGRPLAEGRLSLREVKLLWALYFFLGLLVSLLTSPLHLTVALVAVVLSYLYSARIQSRKYLGNVLVSVLVALSLIYGALGGEVERAVLPAIIVFLVNWGREIYKDIVDGDVDYPKKISLYHILTKRWASFLGGYLVFLGVILTPFPFLYNYVKMLYVPVMALASAIALYGVARSLQDDHAGAERWIKGGMVVALLALLLGAVG